VTTIAISGLKYLRLVRSNAERLLYSVRDPIQRVRLKIFRLPRGDFWDLLSK
jgi:hypothetical protein